MIKQDYKPRNNSEFSKNWEKLDIPAWLTHPFLIIGMAVCTLLLAIVLSISSETPPEETNIELAEIQLIAEETATEVEEHPTIENKTFSDPIAIPIDLTKKQNSQTKVPVPDVSDKWDMESVKKGDNLSLIFKRIGLTPRDVYEVITLDDNAKLLKKLKPGELINYQLNESNQLVSLKYTIDVQQTLYIERGENGLTSRLENKAIEYRTAYAHGTINDSLFVAGKKAGLSDSQVMELAGIFEWDVDFILDIRKGDSFSLLYNEKYVEGDKIGNGDIIAAEFINQGKRYTTVRYTDSDNNSSYYTPDGHSMRKAFLRAPLKFSYISSNFKPKRFHPILKRWKAHRGIDYRARTGTPIRAAGDGKVIASSYNKYNGKYVFLQHGQGIVTKYLHMSKRAVSKNKRVKQGQIIGYVGATGLAEAPHLHYEFLVNGVHRNPRTVKLPKAEPIAKSEKARFVATTQPWLDQLTSRNALVNGEQAIAP